MSCDSAALGASYSISRMAKDTLPTTERSSGIDPLESKARTAPLPHTPLKNKRFSFTAFHHKQNGENIDVPKRSATTSYNDHAKEKVQGRRTSSASTAVPTTAGAALGVGAGVSKRSTMGQLNRQNSVQTRYMTMLLHLDEIPRLHNILASFFTVSLFSYTSPR